MARYDNFRRVVAQNITCGPYDAHGVALGLIVDDAYPPRSTPPGHTIFNSWLRHVGPICGYLRDYDSHVCDQLRRRIR